MFRVIQTIQSTTADVGGIRINEPVEMRYYTGPDHVQAISALVQAATAQSDNMVEVLAVRIEMV